MTHRISDQWILPGLGSIRQIEDHGLGGYDGKPLYEFKLATSDRPCPEWFPSLDRALVSLVAAKYTGERGAGGTGVDTAAGWFMRMIGADQLVPAEYQSSRKAMTEALAAATQEHNGPLYARGRAVADELEARGLVLAAQNHGAYGHGTT